MRFRLNHLSVVLVVLLAVISVPAAAQEATLAKPIASLQVSGTSIEVSWESIEGAARYEVWQWTQAGGWVRKDDGNLTATSLTITGLTVGTAYWYAVRAVNQNGQTGEWSEYVSGIAVADPTPTPVPPTSTPVPTATGAIPQPTGATVLPTYTPYPTYTPFPTPAPTQAAEWCRVAQENTIQGGTLDKYRDSLTPRPQVTLV